MKKFECKECPLSKPCILQVDGDAGCPRWCPYSGISLWQEVKEETTTDCNHLPDWCKVGEWVYAIEKKQYQTISLINGTVICNNIDGDGCTQYGYGAFMGDCVKARKRPFNAEEMRGLVGKVIQDRFGNCSLISNYLIVNNQVTVFCAYYNAKKLIESDFTIDGKPCYVLEHIENGEWVE